MGRKSKGSKPQSGIPGLLWRQRGNSGSWVVSLNVPTELRERLVSSTGKPLARLERSTQTDSLAHAKKRYPEVMAALRGELEEKAGRNLETPVDRIKRWVALTYFQQSTGEFWPEKYKGEQLKQKINALKKRAPDQSDLIDFLAKDIVYHLNDLLIICDKELTLDQKKEARQSLKFAIDQAKKAAKAKDEQGYFSVAPPGEKVFREALKGSTSTSFEEVLKYKRDEVTDRTLSNLKITISNWKKIIGSSSLESITTVNLNRFARDLKRPKTTGGRGFTTNAANDSAVRIRSLIRTYNVNISDESQRIDWPAFDPIQQTTVEKKAQKIKARAITVKDAIKVLGYAKEKDEYAWRALLILSNSTFRASEVCALRWGNIKELDGIIYFDLTDSKTVAGLRRLPLNSRLRTHLLPLRGSDDEFIINNSWPTWNRPRDGLGHFLTAAKKDLQIAGRTNPHSFRHAAGGDLGYSQPEHIKKKLMGHVGGITDHYTREDMKVLNEAVESIGFDF